MFDSKIKIYVKFRVWKRYLLFWGAKFLPPFLGYRPLILASFFPKTLSKSPQISARRTFFQKRSPTIVVLRWMMSSPGRKVLSSQKRRCPTKKTAKSAVFAQLGMFFSKIGGASPFLGWEDFSLQIPHRSTQNYSRRWAFWKKRPSGRDLGAFLTPILAKKLNFGQILVFLALNSSNYVRPQV